MIFKYAELSDFLNLAHSQVGVFPLRDWKGQAGLILRHDVDLDIAPMASLADIEEAAGVRSSFFVMVTSDTYNVCSQPNRRILRDLQARGFEIGLHFDPTVYETATPSDIPRLARKEADVLADVLGSTIDAISLHNPTIHGAFEVEGFVNAYDKRIFDPERYLSDSRMRFRADPRTLLELAKHKTCQLLLHPLHFSSGGVGYPAPFVTYIDRRIDAVDGIFRVNSAYRESVTSHLRDHVARAIDARRPRGKDQS